MFNASFIYYLPKKRFIRSHNRVNNTCARLNIHLRLYWLCRFYSVMVTMMMCKDTMMKISEVPKKATLGGHGMRAR